jgi:hypothetical protein
MEDQFDFFISYASADRAWAEWVAWQLIEAGYTVELDVWNWGTGRNFVLAISDALERCDRVVALFSAAYFDRSRYTTEEWTSAMLRVPGTAEGKLVPVRVEAVATAEIPSVLRPLVYRDLFGMTEEQARQVLLEATAGPHRPDRRPLFPGHNTPTGPSRLGRAGPRLPGTIPPIWNIQARNPGFTGRDGLLVEVRERLLAGDRTVVQALRGMGGVGKTQLAVEYAYRFAGAYDLAWWVNSEQGGLIGEHFAALGLALGCIEVGADLEVVRAAVLAELRKRERWLLVFDNAENPADIARWLPGGNGHVLITSRERSWDEIAAPVEVDILARDESVAILQRRVAGLGELDADRLADELGDLPLGIVQAAGFIAETGTPAAEYLELLRTRPGQLMDKGTPASYSRSLAAATGMIADRLAAYDSAAAQLASLCAFLAPELIPIDWFNRAFMELPSELAARVADPMAWPETVAQLARQSLARVDQRGLQMHRLTQAILRSDLSSDLASVTRSRVEAVLAANNPGDPDMPESWPRWTQLMPHLLFLDLAESSNTSLRELACNAATYLDGRGDFRTAYDFTRRLYQRWRDRLGPDDHTLWMAGLLASAAREMNLYDEARDLDQDILAQRRSMLGEDHPSTLNSATNLASDLSGLGDTQAARELHEDTLARKRRVLGEDDPSTLSSANNLAITLKALGQIQTARDLNENTLARRRRILGEHHPKTLDSAYNLAFCLYDLGDYQAARNLDQDTLEHRRRVLAAEHPSTLASANRLAVDLHEMGELEAARDLHQDTLRRRRRILGDDHPDTMVSANNLAIVLREMGELEAARDLHQDTFDRCRRILGENHLSTLASANNLADDLRELGELEAARNLHQDSFDRSRRILGENHPSALTLADNLAIDFHQLGELEAARNLHQNTFDRCRRILDENHPSTLRAANNLADDLRQLGETQAARDLDQDTLDRLRRVLGENHPSTLGSANNLAGDFHQLGELEAARDLYQDTLARYQRVLGDHHPDTLRAASNLGEALHALGKLGAARDLYQDTLARYQRVLGENHPDTLDVVSSLAQVSRELGESQEMPPE